MTKTKTLLMFLMTALLAVSVVLATDTFTVNPSSFEFIQPNDNFKFSITPTDLDDTVEYTYTLTVQDPILDDDGNAILFSIQPTSGDGAISGITVTAINLNYDKLSIGKDYSGNLIITKSFEGSEDIDTTTIQVNFLNNFCKAGEQGTDLEITKIRIDNNDGDDEEWSPLDEIEIEVEVSNNGDDRIKDVFVEMALFNLKGKDVTNDLEFTGSDDEEIDLGRIKENDEKTATFTFTIPADFEADTYKLVIKAYSEDKKEINLCTSKSDEFEDSSELFTIIDGEREDDDDRSVIFYNIKISPSPAQCNERVQVSGKIVNIGRDDYDDQVKVTLFNSELNLNLEETIRKDLKEGDSRQVDFEFDIPEGAEEKLYTLKFQTFYDYDDRDDDYEFESEEEFKATFRVGGNCEVEIKDAQISAQLDPETPEAVPGKQIIISSKIRNTGDVETTYTISVLGNSEWSSLDSIEPRSITLNPGESRDINLVLTVNKDAQGDNELTIRATSDGQVIAEQRISLLVGKASGITGDAQLGPFVNHLRNNWFIYLIVLVNVVLIIAIILVIRSMVSPRPL